ncbi:unnamed protein product [Lymnaea stagnalis]|uniref:Major facilitator superfamily (MFS) profile domain-containing protein n=1 Tax=Lymnaea stagnalis TaxID=6523 RepID=A0AAV2HXW8_LYMST
MNFEDLIHDLGGFGKFQMIIVFCIHYNRIFMGWSMLQMSYAGRVHDWFCLSWNDTQPRNDTLNACAVRTDLRSGLNSTGVFLNSSVHDVTACHHYVFPGTASTIIDEWDLVCDKKWVKATVTSIQMAGVLLGSLLSGHLGDHFGRKTTMYIFLLMHAAFNVITAFSVSWEMFAVCRFCIGFGLGAALVVFFPYGLEFLPITWRPLVSVLPFWQVGVSLFALLSYLMEDWSHLHLTCGLLALPGLLGYFFLPESMRWLTVKNRLDEAQKAVEMIAAINKKPFPEKTRHILQTVVEEEQRTRVSGKQYTYIDIFRGWQTAKLTMIFCFHWQLKYVISKLDIVDHRFSLSLVYYGISFGVSSLAGNLSFNIFLVGVIEIPAKVSTFYFNNKFGRKRTSIAFLSMACVSAFSSLLVIIFVSDARKGHIVTGLCLLAKMGTNAGWTAVETWGTELSPTVTRSLSYGAVSTAARLGGIIAPFAINLDDRLILSYAIIGGLLLLDILLAFFVQESRGMVLSDSLTVVTKPNGAQPERPGTNGDNKIIVSFDGPFTELSQTSGPFIELNQTLGPFIKLNKKSGPFIDLNQTGDCHNFKEVKEEDTGNYTNDIDKFRF